MSEGFLEKTNNLTLKGSDSQFPIFDLLSTLENSELKIYDDEYFNKSVEVCLFLDQNLQNKIHFKIIFLKGMNYVEYIPIQLDFPLKENNFTVFSYELEIPLSDVTSLINAFIEIRNKYAIY